jgi:hypothetical protein
LKREPELGSAVKTIAVPAVAFSSLMVALPEPDPIVVNEILEE